MAPRYSAPSSTNSYPGSESLPATSTGIGFLPGGLASACHAAIPTATTNPTNIETLNDTKHPNVNRNIVMR